MALSHWLGKNIGVFILLGFFILSGASYAQQENTHSKNVRLPDIHASTAFVSTEGNVSWIFSDHKEQYGRHKKTLKKNQFQQHEHKHKSNAPDNRRYGLRLDVSSPGVEQTTYSGAEVISFSARAIAKYDKDVSDLIVWQSSLDGWLGEGGDFETYLTAGTHTITATIETKSRVSSWRKNIDVDSYNTPTISVASAEESGPIEPFVKIDSPADGDIYIYSEQIDYESSKSVVASAEIVNEVLVSSLDGVIEDLNYLSLGQHTLILTVTDSQGLSSSDSITIEILDTTHTRPTIDIIHPQDNSTYVLGAQILVGTDTNNAEDGSKLSWSSSIDGAFTNFRNLSVGQHVITVTITESSGLTGTDSILLHVMDIAFSDPNASIDSPSDGDIFSRYDDIPYSYSYDAIEGMHVENVTLTSDIDGTIIDLDNLSVGLHTLTLTVNYLGGWFGYQYTDSIALKIVEYARPSVDIISPHDGGVFSVEDIIYIAFNTLTTGDVKIIEEVLTSSIDGVINNLYGLSVGQHTVTLTVTDTQGLTSSDSVTIKIIDNTPPTMEISTLIDGSVISQATRFVLPLGVDVEDGNLPAIWSSNIDGVFTMVNELSLGHHIITATVTDRGGLTASDTIRIEVIAPDPSELIIFHPLNEAVISANENPVYLLMGEKETPAPPDAILLYSIVLSSSIDGIISNPATLSIGQHTITATADTRLGNKVSTQVNLKIIP